MVYLLVILSANNRQGTCTSHLNLRHPFVVLFKQLYISKSWPHAISNWSLRLCRRFAVYATDRSYEDLLILFIFFVEYSVYRNCWVQIIFVLFSILFLNRTCHEKAWIRVCQPGWTRSTLLSCTIEHRDILAGKIKNKGYDIMCMLHSQISKY